MGHRLTVVFNTRALSSFLESLLPPPLCFLAMSLLLGNREERGGVFLCHQRVGCREGQGACHPSYPYLHCLPSPCMWEHSGSYRQPEEAVCKLDTTCLESKKCLPDSPPRPGVGGPHGLQPARFPLQEPASAY